jgi:hypothetical protein
MKSTRGITLACLTLIALVAFSGQAFSLNYAQVGTCTPPNPPAHTFTTIQLAVTNSAPGTIIQICPGTYPEQVVVGKKLTLIGVGTTPSSPAENAAVIVPPSTGVVANASDVDDSHPIAAQLLVQNTFTGVVAVTNLTVDGLGNQISGCGPDLMGILFQNSAGTVNHVAVRNQVPGDVLSGCQSGESIFVQSGSGLNSKVTVENSSVHNYNKNGITGNDAGTKLILTANYVQGSGLVANIAAQNGIQLAFGATGTITTQTVIDNVYQDSSTAATDILLYDTAESSGVAVNTNILGNSQIPLGLFTTSPGTTGDGVTIKSNKIFGTSSFDAIDVCTNGNTITSNTITNSAESAIHLDTSCGAGVNNTVSANTILESACAGVLFDSASNSLGAETFYTVPFPFTQSAASCPFVTSEARTKGRAPNSNRFSPKR